MSQICFILTGIAMGCLLGEENALAARGALLYMVNHSLFKLVLFMAAGVVYMNLHKLNLNDVRGFGRKKPILHFAFLMGAVGLMGVPGFSGYVSKTLIHEGIVEYAELLAEEGMGALLTAAANAHTSLVVPDTADLQQLKCRPLENYVDYGGYRALLQFPGKHQTNHAAMAVEIALALWREYHYEIPDEAIETGLRDAKMPARIEVMRRHPLLLLDGCHNADGTAALAATLKEAGYDGNLVAVLGLLKDKDHSKMLENLAPCFEKVFTVTPDSPRAMTAEELEEEAKYHMDAEAAPSVAKAIRLAVDYADENNLAGVVVCGSLYLAAQARPLLLKEAEK